jgi:hypothetical protein
MKPPITRALLRSRHYRCSRASSHVDADLAGCPDDPGDIGTAAGLIYFPMLILGPIGERIVG